MSIANAMQTFAEAMGDMMESLRESLQTVLYGSQEVSIGDRVKVYHPQTGFFVGHIAELRTENTATVARQTDGVLIHVPRDAIKYKYD